MHTLTVDEYFHKPIKEIQAKCNNKLLAGSISTEDGKSIVKGFIATHCSNLAFSCLIEL